MDLKSQIKIKPTKFKVVFEEKQYKAWCSSSCIQGSILISGDNIIVRWDDFSSEGLSMKSEEDNTLFDPKWFEAFQNQNSFEMLNLYVVIQKYDVTELNYFEFENLKETKSYPNLKKIEIKLTQYDYEREEIINKILSSISKKVIIEINGVDDSGLLKSERFWIELLNFNKVFLQGQTGTYFTINREDLELDQTNILKSRFNIIRVIENETITINKIIKSLFHNKVK